MRKPDLAARLTRLAGDFRLVQPTLRCPKCGATSGFDLRQVVHVYYAIEGEAEDRAAERALLVNSDVFAFDTCRPPTDQQLLCGNCREEFSPQLPIHFL
ncbi:MAG TPA: hypothetical protein VGF28_11335 [Thermoanaerobaculia bacterium]